MIRFDHGPDGDALTLAPGGFNHAIDHVVACISKDGRLLGGVTYEKFTGASICMHSNSFDPHWLTRDILWVMFHYPFVQLGVKKILGFVPSTNTRALAFNKKMGLIVECRIVDACPGGDLVVMTMRREDCRWLAIRPTGIEVTAQGNLSG